MRTFRVPYRLAIVASHVIQYQDPLFRMIAREPDIDLTVLYCSRRRIRARLMRMLFALTTGFMTSGVLNAEYYRHYGADPRRFFLLPWAIDNERFARESALAPGEREALRARYGIAPDAVVFLFSAKLVERKDPFALLKAYERMRHRERAAVVFMGDGVLRAPLESYARDHALGGAHFIGFLNQSALPRHYAMADVFVLPSTYEPRGA